MVDFIQKGLLCLQKVSYLTCCCRESAARALLPVRVTCWKRDSINCHLLDAISETATVHELRQQLLYTTPSRGWWCLEPLFRTKIASQRAQPLESLRAHSVTSYNTHICISLSHSLSLSLYIYIYMYTYIYTHVTRNKQPTTCFKTRDNYVSVNC